MAKSGYNHQFILGHDKKSFIILQKKIVDNKNKNAYNRGKECKESKECKNSVEGRLLYGTCKGYIKRTDYNTNRN